MNEMGHNWSGNVRYAAVRLHQPESVAQLQEVVARSQRVKVIGSRHCFNTIADTDGDHISLYKMDKTLTVDSQRGTVTVSGGITYGELFAPLAKAGRALHNTASLPHITVAGAIATATHGSGDGNGNLATAVSALEIVTASGEIVSLSRAQNGDRFAGAVVGLGALGVVTSVTLDTQPAFMMQQEVYEDLPVASLEAHFNEIFSSAYSVSLFTDWRDQRVNQVWLKRRLTDGAGLVPAATFHGATLAGRNVHPVTHLPADPCTPQMGVPGPWHKRLPHFMIDQTPASGDELQTEYFVARQHGVAALAAMAGLQKEMEEVLLISEVRTVAADDLWLSTAYGQDTVAIHFSWKNDWPRVRRVLTLLEAALAPFAPRAHWGKLFTIPNTELHDRYTKMNDFRALVDDFDPQKKFRNDYLQNVIFATA